MTDTETESETEDFFEEPRTPYTRMIFLWLLITLPCYLGVKVNGYAAVALPQMSLTLSEASWFGSVPGFASPIGGILISHLIDVHGRKLAMMIALTSHILGWLLLYTDYSFSVLLLGRIFTGIPSGSFFYLAQVYTTECIAVNDHNFRMNFSGFSLLLNGFGLFETFLLALFVGHREIAAFNAISSCILLLLISIVIPESPMWLYLQGRINEAKNAQKKLGIFQPILHRMLDSGPQSVKQFVIERNLSCSKIKKWLKDLCRKDVRKPLIRMTVVGILMFSTGGRVMVIYLIHSLSSGSLETKISRTNSQFYKYGVVLGASIFASTLFSCFMSRRLGIKKLSITAAGLLCLGYGITGGASLASVSLSNLAIINMIGLCLVVCAYFGGILHFPLTVLSDVFPHDAKGFGGLTVLTMNLYSSVLVKAHPHLYSYFEGKIYFGYLLSGILYGISAFYFAPGKDDRTGELGEKLLQTEEEESTDILLN